MRKNPSSFRDNSGHVYENGSRIVRSIAKSYAADWDYINQCGLLDKAVAECMIPAVKAIEKPDWLSAPDIHAAIEVEKIPFISYPYEWSFQQLKDAALLTLKLQRMALEYNCILKDASAYNVQFIGGKPIFIDILSFEKWDGEKPWDAYRQFCQHFLAPLALEAWLDLRCGLFPRQFIDGMPLDLACSMLPLRARASLGLGLHIFLHSKMQQKHADARESGEKAKKVRLSKEKLLDLTDSLASAVSSLKPVKNATEWGDYYTDTNYTDAAMQDKAAFVAAAARHCGQGGAANGLAVDLGANDGYFSRLLCPHFNTVVAADIDAKAVGQHYEKLAGGSEKNILPLVQDLTSPSPALGWALRERESFPERARADMLMALALCHHLHFTGGIPFAEIAAFFASMLKPGGSLLVEFAPAQDSQVQRLLAARDMNLDYYTLENFTQAFANAGLVEAGRHAVAESGRTLLVFQKSAVAV